MTRFDVWNRRAFVQGLAGAGLLAAVRAGRGAGVAERKALQAGLQLYAVREPLAADAPGTLQALREIGFRNVEAAGTGKYAPAEFRKLVADAGLAMPSAHVGFTMDNDLGAPIAEAKALGVRYATSSFLRKLTDPGRVSLGNGKVEQPALPPMGLDGFKRMAARMNEIGRAVHAAGLEYAYHNHNFEFEKMPDGLAGYDVLLRETDKAMVKFEVDCGWMVAAGSDPVAYFNKYPGRFRMLHIKDFKPLRQPTIDLVGPDRPEGTELGSGFIDNTAIFAAAPSAGIEYVFAEQEAPYTRPQLDSARVSYAYLKRFLG